MRLGIEKPVLRTDLNFQRLAHSNPTMVLCKFVLVVLLWISWGQVDVSGNAQDDPVAALTLFLKRIQENWPTRTTTNHTTINVETTSNGNDKTTLSLSR